MFARGFRFPPSKPSDVPGPGHYNIQDVDDPYKHGAFLEKTDRFDKDKESDVPGPGAYTTMERPKSRVERTVPTNSNDRFAILQKKLEDLERVHIDGKKEHRAEQERLKRELAVAQRTSAEQAEQLGKTKQQLELRDAHIRELNKAKTTADAELKGLRTTLRLAEAERAQRAAKAEAETKRRDDLRDKDRRIAELERTVAAERAEAAKNLDSALSEARDAEADVCDQLETFKTLISAAAAQYGRLAATTVSASAHTLLKTEYAALQIRQARLERKLANSEDQVQELAHLIRQTKDQSHLLSSQLMDAEIHTRSSSRFLRVLLSEGPSSSALDTAYALQDLGDTIHQAQLEERVAYLAFETAQQDLWRHEAQDLLHAFTSADETTVQLSAALKGRDAALSNANSARTALVAELDAARNALVEAERLRAKAESAVQDARKTEMNVLKEVEDMKQIQVKRETAHASALQKEKEVARRSAATLQKSKLAEEALQTEIEHLTAELMEAIKYQHAYEELTEQVAGTIARSTLAEDEAKKLSKFNAEILGHQNASQKIMYVDRIRRELAETKQKLLTVTREHDAVTHNNQDLRHELDMYTSVMDDRPRTGITRVTRVPLATQSTNGKHSTARTGAKSNLENVQEAEVRPGDLTMGDLV